MAGTLFTVSEQSYATHGQRAGNYMIDNFVLAVLVVALFILNAKFGDGSFVRWYMNLRLVEEYFFLSITEALYYMIIEFAFGTTLGKLATRTKIVDAYGERPHKVSFIIRSLARMIPLERFSFLTAFCRGWHDKVSETYVVDIETFNKEKEAFNRNRKSDDHN